MKAMEHLRPVSSQADRPDEWAAAERESPARASRSASILNRQ